MMKTAHLVLSDGSVFTGNAFGADISAQGMLVFHTAASGTPEILSDPCCMGDMLLMTSPLIGISGVDLMALQSGRLAASALCAREICALPSNHNSYQALPVRMAHDGVPGIDGLDTRQIAKHLRTHGATMALLDTSENIVLLRQRAALLAPASDLVKRATIAKPIVLPGDGPRVAVLDLGASRDFLAGIACALPDACITRYPADTGAERILRDGPALLAVSGGPGSPYDCAPMTDMLRALVGKLPIYAMGLGMQLIALALGARATRMRFGHHGDSHPVCDLRTGRAYGTVQHHLWTVTLPERATLTHRHLDDGTVEGFYCEAERVLALQFTPQPNAQSLDSGSALSQLTALAV